MKKIYEKPCTDIVVVELQKMIADSLPMDNNGIDGRDALGRGYDDWDDDDY